MFTIEHEFDASVITLVDEGEPPLREDVVIRAFADRVTLEQHDLESDAVREVTLSPGMMRDLSVAMKLPEGAYEFARDGGPSGPGSDP